MVTRPHYDTPPGVSLNPKSKWMMENLRLMSPPDSSTNLEELARFQQKQLQEKEQKLLQLYDQQQQRAHQVAQRGSAGSNGSTGSGKNSIITTTGSVRQLFEERRQQSNVKGIDKSYPLDPLRSKKKPTGQAVNGRRNNAQPAKRGTTRTNGTVQAANNNRAAAVSRESYASSRSSSNSYKDSSIQRESFTRESYASSRGDYDEPSESSRQQLNGHAKHYEINIDEVIDNEAMERNRLLAKFHQVDVDKRRHFDIESDGIPGDENYFGSRRSSLDPPRNTAAALKSNNNARKSNALTAATVAPVTAAVAAAVNATKKPAIPTGASTTRNSTSDYKAKKNVAPYPSSKSPDNLSEKSRASGSLKFLGRLSGSNGELENGFSTAARKSKVSAVDGLMDDNDEKQSGYVAAAPRTTSSLSSNSSVGTNRSHGSTASRPAGKPKAAPPTPAARSTPSSKGSAASNDDSLSTCKICNRRFATDRIGLHEQICAKTSQKKRKQFDALTHRVKGTELESFVQKPVKKQGKAAAKPAAASVEPSKSNWRRKHEDFINAIRSAKQMQAHLASGGKLSDLPPPPPSDTSDYIQCPHCSRKFNQGAAERHIPKCANMQHNKPNPRAPPRSRR